MGTMEMIMALVSAFLRKFKSIASQKGVYFVNRAEHKDALLELGLTQKNRDDEVMSLSVTDYCSGPEPDETHDGEVWVFGKDVSGHQIYIKLKIAVIDGEEVAKCISFHKAQHPMCFKFRN